MTVSIDWATFIITVEQSDMIFVTGSVWELDADWFRRELKSIEDSEEGIPFPDTHIHTGETTLSGVTYSRFVEIIAPYSITFDDTPGPYVVSVVGANTNVLDVLNPNLVSVRTSNTAGLVTPPDQVDQQLLISHIIAAGYCRGCGVPTPA